MPDSLSVRPASAHEAPTIAAVLATASQDEAVVSWVVPDERVRRERLAASLEQATQWLSDVVAGGGVVVAGTEDASIAGLSVWEYEDGTDTGSEASAAELAAFFEPTYGEYAPRMALVHELTRRRHPRTEAHWYLQQMVVVPEQRGRGLGAAMLRYRLARADADRVPVYLEASTPRNRALYERHGFHPLGDPIRLPEDGPAIQPMWRPTTPG
ncbi:GNAT family N-acetyltransferase [Micromonospora sp. NPDC050397]|uniref:GNAT family N-acetyltransferase n=1 Tax=Micromonospora sp. NPDC050397 TaxID=3364279 RepID=UPI003850B14A